MGASAAQLFDIELALRRQLAQGSRRSAQVVSAEPVTTASVCTSQGRISAGPPEVRAAAVASFLAAVLNEIYLCNFCSCQEIDNIETHWPMRPGDAPGAATGCARRSGIIRGAVWQAVGARRRQSWKGFFREKLHKTAVRMRPP
jgi:hypothetical protein